MDREVVVSEKAVSVKVEGSLLERLEAFEERMNADKRYKKISRKQVIEQALEDFLVKEERKNGKVADQPANGSGVLVAGRQ